MKIFTFTPNDPFASMEFLSYTIFALGLLLSVKTFFYETGHSGANRFLGAFLFCCAILHFEFAKYFQCDSPLFMVGALAGLHQIYFLVGPMAYFYVRGTLRADARLKPLEYLHFSPFFIFVIGLIPFIILPWEEKLAVVRLLCEHKWGVFLEMQLNLLMPIKYAEFVRIMSVLCYGVAQWVLVWKYHNVKASPSPLPSQYMLVKRWLVIFVLLYSIMTVQRILLGSLIIVFDESGIFEKVIIPASLSLSVMYILTNFGIFIFNSLLNGLMITPEDQERKIGMETELPSASVPEEQVTGEEALQMWYKTLFQKEYLENIGGLLEKWSEEKKYLNRANLTDLSQDINIPSHHLTYYFNNILGVKFTNWRNDLRINHATSLIDEGFLKTQNLDGLADTCGYSSRTSFSRVFKEITGFTPSEYQGSREIRPPD